MRAGYWWGGAFVAVVAIVITLLGPSGLAELGTLVYSALPVDARPRDRHRVAVQVTAEQGGQTVSNTTYYDCWSVQTSGFSTGRNTALVQDGEEPFVVLPDRSIMLLSRPSACLWFDKKPKDGAYAEYFVDPAATSWKDKPTGNKISMASDHIRRYDSIDNPQTVASYLQHKVFAGEVDIVRLKEIKISFVEADPNTELPKTLAQQFHWLRDVPTVRVGDDAAYLKSYHLSNFRGFELELLQMPPEAPCKAAYPEDPEPRTLVDDDECYRFGKSLGWMVGTPAKDFARIDYSLSQLTQTTQWTLYRETMLREIHAPGDFEETHRWQPRVCIDNKCAGKGFWKGRAEMTLLLHYPSKNLLIKGESVNYSIGPEATGAPR